METVTYAARPFRYAPSSPSCREELVAEHFVEENTRKAIEKAAYAE